MYGFFDFGHAPYLHFITVSSRAITVSRALRSIPRATELLAGGLGFYSDDAFRFRVSPFPKLSARFD